MLRPVDVEPRCFGMRDIAVVVVVVVVVVWGSGEVGRGCCMGWGTDVKNDFQFPDDLDLLKGSKSLPT